MNSLFWRDDGDKVMRMVDITSDKETEDSEDSSPLPSGTKVASGDPWSARTENESSLTDSSTAARISYTRVQPPASVLT